MRVVELVELLNLLFVLLLLYQVLLSYVLPLVEAWAPTSLEVVDTPNQQEGENLEAEKEEYKVPLIGPRIVLCRLVDGDFVAICI